jgi:hypothetical protein
MYRNGYRRDEGLGILTLRFCLFANCWTGLILYAMLATIMRWLGS